MLLNSAAIVAAVLASASQVAAEPTPSKPLRKMSIDDIFGIGRRQEGGYTPTLQDCTGSGTCAEACGAGYIDCNTSLRSCYNPGEEQECCKYGKTCSAGYFCMLDTEGHDYCCPDGESASQCAARYGVSTLYTDLDEPTSTSTPTEPTTTSTPTEPTTTSTPTEPTTTSTPAEPTTSTPAAPTTSTPAEPTTTPATTSTPTSTTSTPAPPVVTPTTAPYGSSGNGTHNTTTYSTTGSSSPTTSVVTANAVVLMQPAVVAVVLLVACAYAALL